MDRNEMLKYLAMLGHELQDRGVKQYGKALTMREFELIKSWKNKLVGKFIL